jgi:hypothetical protein
MNKSTEIINKINNEYYRLLIGHLKNLDVCSLEYPANKVWTEVTSNRGLVFNSSFGRLNSVQYKALALLNDVFNFWKTNKDSYKEASKAINSDKSFDTQFNQNQFLFFDTIILYHLAYRNALLVFDKKAYEPIETTTMIIRMMRDIQQALPYLNTNHDKPMIILDIAEDFNESKIINVYGNEVKVNEQERSIQNINEVIREISIGKAKELSIIDYHLISQKKGVVDVSQFFDTSKLIELLDAKKMDESFSTAKEWNAFMNGDTKIVISDLFSHLIQGIVTSIMDMDCQEDGSFEYGADPVVNHLSLYKRRLTIESTRTSQALGQSLEFGIAQSLKLPNFDWIREMSNEDIIHFRENDGTSFLREIFSEQKNEIRNASIENFESISKKATQTIKEVVIEENKKLIVDKEIVRKKLVKSGISFGVTIALGVVSVALPPLLAIAIPSAVFSSVVGSASIKDINQLLNNKKEGERLMRERPVGILTKYLDKV